jgi:hypothetical protein
MKEEMEKSLLSDKFLERKTNEKSDRGLYLHQVQRHRRPLLDSRGEQPALQRSKKDVKRTQLQLV